MTTIDLLKKTKAAWGSIRSANAEEKNRLLLAMAESLEANQADILRENQKDMDAARGSISDVMLDRLALTQARIHAMADGIREAAALPDHVGRALAQFTRPNGMTITKRQVPLGLVAIIYESRPNVTSDAAALCIKSGNVCMLRSGKEAYRSSHAIVTALKAGIESVGSDGDIVNIVEDTTHASAQALMTADGLVDLLIPRGGAGLIRACVENATVPCIETGTGICHVYVDKDADLDMAVKIIVNAKTSRPSVCNAEEVCLVHRAVAKEFLPKLRTALVDERKAAGLAPVELRLDEAAAEIIPGTSATERDFDTEFLDYILAVAVVDDLDAAIAHVQQHSTHHSDCIVTENKDAAARFVDEVDSAAVYVNVSTRFTDGGEFGLGCEMGISTQKLHARGPMGLDELSTYKYVITGSGQVR
jgi:glutamate-5-semialdehyde dehydrogenase